MVKTSMNQGLKIKLIVTKEERAEILRGLEFNKYKLLHIK